MRDYLFRRLLLLIPNLLLVTILVFGLMRIVPGDVLLLKVGEGVIAGQADIEALRKQLGLDKPFHLQYLEYVWGVMRLDLGKSLWSERPVLDMILVRAPVTFELAVLAIFLSLLVAIPIGIIAAVRQDTFLDYLLRSFSIAGLSLPSFWIATLVITLPSIWFRWMPTVQYTPFLVSPLENLKQFLIPAMILGLVLSASVMRMTRTMMLEVMRQDYIRTAWAKGLQESTVIYRHALKNALIPVVTIMGLQIAFLIGGSVILESIFGLPGLGALMLSSINNRDYPVVQGINLIVAAAVLVINLLVDLSYGYLDPRIRYR